LRKERRGQIQELYPRFGMEVTMDFFRSDTLFAPKKEEDSWFGKFLQLGGNSST